MELSDDVYSVIKEVIAAEFKDKTFCLIIIFTLSWTNWRAKNFSRIHYHPDGKVHYVEKQYSVHPIRVLLDALIGVCLITLYNVFQQTNLYENASKLICSMLLVSFLVFYMYSLCNYQIENLIGVEKINSQVEQEK